MELMTLKSVCILVMAATVAPDDPPIFLDQGLSPGAPGCSDVEPKCSVWASQGECQTNAAWMMSNCRRSCQSCQGGERAWQLRLTIAAHYDNTSGIRNYSINHVKLNSFHVDHIEMDEQKQTAKLHGKLVFTWNDSRVAWDKQRWGVSWLNFYWVQIWTPQVVQSNSPPSTPAQISSKILAANYTGQVYMWADFSMTTLCDMDYSNYPYDVQKCTFKLDDRRYYAVRFTVAQSAIEEAKISARKVHAAGWKTQSCELNQNKYSVNVLADWSLDPFNVETSNVDAILILKRDHSYYGAEIVGPLVVPAVVTLVSFLAGSFWNQIALLLVSLLFQLLVSVTVNGQLPPASGEVPAILKYSSFNMAMTCIVLITCAILLTLSTLESTLPPPRFLSFFVEKVEKILPCFSGRIDDTKFGHDGTTAVDSSNPVKFHWAPVAKTVKSLLFIFCLVLYIFVMLACLT